MIGKRKWKSQVFTLLTRREMKKSYWKYIPTNNFQINVDTIAFIPADQQICDQIIQSGL